MGGDDLCDEGNTMSEVQDNEKQSQDPPPTSQKRKSPPRKPPAWDQQKALVLAKKGVPHKDIAAALHIHLNTVQRYLQRIKPELEHLRQGIGLPLFRP